MGKQLYYGLVQVLLTVDLSKPHRIEEGLSLDDWSDCSYIKSTMPIQQGSIMELTSNQGSFELSERQARLILVAEGFASVAVQILLMRQLTPFVGSNAVVNSMIIAVYLGALAMSYAIGGSIEKAQSSRLQQNLLFAGCVLGIGVSYPAMSLFFEVCARFFNGPLIALSLYLTLIVGPMICMLGQTVPLLTNFVKRQRVAKVTGDSFNLSTWGNASGSLITGLVLMLFLGIGWAVFLNALILLMISLYLMVGMEGNWSSAYKVLLAAVVIFGFNVVNEKQQFITTTPYSNYKVITSDDGGRYLEINKSAASYIDEDGNAAAYIEEIRRALFNEMKLTDKEVLVLGAGGFTLSRQGEFGNHFTYVDIDPEIKAIAEEHFLGSEINGDFVSGDARVFVRRQAKGSFDVVVIDLYTNLATIPWHLATREFYEEVRNIISQNGYVFFNVVGYPWLDDPYSKRIDNTIRAVFGNCRVNAGTFGDKPTNLVYACKKSVKFENDNTLYSDVNSRGTHDSYVTSMRGGSDAGS